MAKLKVAVDVPVAPHRAWEHTSDLAELGTWLTMHEGWRGAVPAELTPGTTLVGVATVKGLRNRVTWTVQTAEPPSRLVLHGSGKGGTRFSLGLLVAAKGSGSEVTVDLELGGAPLFGPIGSGVAKAIRGDIERSLGNFVARYGA